MGGQLGGPGPAGEASRFRPWRTRGVRGAEAERSPLLTRARLPNGGPGVCPRFGRLG